MTLWTKLKSRKLWVAAAGMITTAVADKPVLSAILGGVYVIVEGIIDAVRSKDTAK
jgi:hypothetical protein